MTALINKFRSVFLILGILLSLALPKVSYAYPVFAQQAYENPREATGRIVCANCHLAQKPTEIEVPQAVLPDTVFEAVVGIPYDLKSRQVTAGGTKGPLNVGAVLVLSLRCTSLRYCLSICIDNCISSSPNFPFLNF